MVFSSLFFLFVFFPVVLLGYYGFLQELSHRNLFLLIASLLFYAWGEPTYVVLMLISIGMNFRLGLMLDNAKFRQRKACLWGGIFLNLFFLFVFKYEGFVYSMLEGTLARQYALRIAPLDLPLPIGISFFTFQAISYLVDVSRGTAPVQKSVLNLGLYISFFPQLVAGPIVRYETFASQILNRRTKYAQFTKGVKRFIIGISKKIIFANQFSLIATESFAYDHPSAAFAWLGAIAYTLQIYYDFSGYSDMAIGLGKMFGFDFLENFNYPYISKTVSEFWRRWHISLGSWFRDYVYIPLGGSRVRGSRLVWNLLVVWLLTGIWHGANWQFICWGLIYFAVLTVEKFLNIEQLCNHLLFSLPYRLVTLLIVLCAWVIFGESSLGDGLQHLYQMFSVQHLYLDDLTIKHLDNDAILLIAGVLFSTPLIPAILQSMEKTVIQWRNPFLFRCYDIVMSTVYMLLFYISVSYLVMGSHNPFIYFNF